MANYAYSPTPFSNINTGPWAQAVAAMSFPQTAYYNNVSPEDAYNTFIRSVAPSNANEALMRKLYDVIRSQYTANAYTTLNQNGNWNAQKTWLDYLRDYNWNKNTARYSPEARGEQPSNFYRSNVRTINF